MADVFLLCDVFRKCLKDSTSTYVLNRFYFVSISGYSYACALNKTEK